MLRPSLATSLTFLTFAAFTSACSDSASDSSTPSDELLAPPAAGAGIQLTMETTIESGVEAEHCLFVKAPDAGLNVNRTETRFTEGSHHVLLYRTNYDEIPTAKLDGTAVDTSGVFDCSDGATNGWDVLDVMAGSQNSKGGTFTEFPPNVAMRVKPGAVMMINAHYLNSTQSDLSPTVKINLETIDDDQVEHEGGVLFFYNIFIRADGMSQSKARMRCGISNEITLMNAQSHMHRRGVDYVAELIGPDEKRETLYTNTHWENVPVLGFEGGRKIAAGSQLEYECTYDNPTETTAWQGPRTSDEMCMFIGAYYPATNGTSFCARDEANGIETSQLGAVWQGDGKGESTCLEALLCVQAAEGLEDITDCVYSVKDSSAKTFSTALSCFFSGGDQTTCATELSACQEEN